MNQLSNLKYEVSDIKKDNHSNLGNIEAPNHYYFNDNNPFYYSDCFNPVNPISLAKLKLTLPKKMEDDFKDDEQEMMPKCEFVQEKVQMTCK